MIIQVRRQARQLIQRYYQGSSAPAPVKFQRSMTLGNPAKETTISRPKVSATGRRVQSASSAAREPRPAVVPIVVEPLTAWEDNRLKSAGKSVCSANKTS